MPTTANRTDGSLSRAPRVGGGGGLPLVLLALALLTSAAPLSAQTILGTLLDQQSGKPVSAGTMSLLAESDASVDRAVTDSAGAFVLSAGSAGSYRLRAERDGYSTAVSPAIELQAGDTVRAEFQLSTRQVVLSPLVVKGEPSRLDGALAGFRERARQDAFGTFLTRDEIEKRHPLRTTDLLRTIPGVQLLPAGLGGRFAVRMRGGCAPAVYLDGMRVRLAGMTIDDLVQPLDLEGIEVYRTGAEVPGEYSFGSGCGAVLIWTRRGE